MRLCQWFRREWARAKAELDAKDLAHATRMFSQEFETEQMLTEQQAWRDARILQDMHEVAERQGLFDISAVRGREISDSIPIAYDEPAGSTATGYDFTHRLRSVLWSLQSENITFDSCNAEIEAVHADIQQAIALSWAARRETDEAKFDGEMKALNGDLEECLWRLKWIEGQRHKEAISRHEYGASGKWARFDYVDNVGVTTKRSITMWEQRGACVVGYDRSRKAERTFRQDRISQWVAE